MSLDRAFYADVINTPPLSIPPKATPRAPMNGRTPYITAALLKACETVANAPEGERNRTLNQEAFCLGGLVASGLSADDAETELTAAAEMAGLPKSEALATARGGLKAGMNSPRVIPELRRNGSNGRVPGTNGAGGVQKLRTPPLAAEPDDAPTRGTNTPATVATLFNFVEVWGADGKIKKDPRRILDIAEQLATITEAWPRRVNSLLFTPHKRELRWLASPEALFSWIAERARVQWAAGNGINGFSLVTKGEFLAHLQATVEAYDGATALPSEPPLPRHYCHWTPPAGYEATGKHLDTLLAFFDNAESPHDAALIRAAFITPAWGGLPGTRPAFIVTAADRGCGKSTLCDALADLHGGAVEVEMGHKAEGEIVTRLLSPDGMVRRVVRLDNVKTSIASPTLEALITSSRISGRQLFVGEGSRPNLITWLITANTPRLSKDIAERAFIIRLKRPQPSPGWRERVFEYIGLHRDKILADCLAMLRAPVIAPVCGDRWQAWLDGVLRRTAPNALQIVTLNQTRRNEHDEDLEESEAIRDTFFALATKLEAWTSEGTAFVAATAVRDAVNAALGVSWSAKKVANVIDAHIESERLSCVKRERVMSCKGYKLQKGAK